MSRPLNLFPEDVARWTAEFEAKDFDPDSFARVIPGGLERYLAGEWTFKFLQQYGCPPDLAERICFAQGQKQAHLPVGGDPWTLAVRTLQDYVEGHWDEPGHELAERLIREHGGPMTPGLRWVLENRPEVAQRMSRRILAEGLPHVPGEGREP